jgi:iron complex transport system substrate-binding protein
MRAARILPLLALLAATACHREGEELARDRGEIVALRRDGSPLCFEAPPQRLVPANAAALEFLAALVGPERIAAMPEQALRYSSAPLSESAWSALPTFAQYSAEVLLAYEPELVVTHAWQDPVTSAFLREQGIGVAVLPELASFEVLRSTLLSLGELLHASARAEELVAELEARVAALSARREDPPPRVLVYTNYGTGGWTAGLGTPENLTLSLLRWRNLAAEAGFRRHAETDLEALLRFDPDWIVVCASGEGTELSGTRQYLEQEPALRSLTAVQTGRILVLPVRLYSTASHHVVEAAEVLASQLTHHPPGLDVGPDR